MRYEFNQGGTESIWDKINKEGDLVWEHKYQALVVDTNDNTYEYLDIEADDIQSATAVVREFFVEDYPDKAWKSISIKLKEE